MWTAAEFIINVFVECLKKNPRQRLLLLLIWSQHYMEPLWILIITKFHPAASIGVGQFKVVQKQCAF